MRHTIIKINGTALWGALLMLALSGCTKLLDKKPITQVVTPNASDSSVTLTGAQSLLQGVYGAFKGAGYGPGIEVNVFDRINNGDVMSDNCYAGGDNQDNIAQDNFTFNSLNSNITRDWSDYYSVIGAANNALFQVAASKDPSLTADMKSQILGQIKFMRAFEYFDLVRLWGAVPLVINPIDASSSESLIKSSGGLRSPVDSVFAAILSDLWAAKGTVIDPGVDPSKYTVTKGVVNALLAKVYATKAPINWDSVAYYCDQVIPHYRLMPRYADLFDINHKDNSESIWEITYDGYSSSVGNWVPSLFQGAGYKKFMTPTNDLVKAFNAEGDTARLNASITFVNYGWPDKYWTTPTNYPVMSKYTDPNNGYNDMYMIRLADILLLRAEAYNNKSDLANAALMVNQVRARAKIGPVVAASQADMTLAIDNERRLELAFEGQRWFDLLRTGRAKAVMNAQKDASGNTLYNVQDFRLLFPVPQTQIDLNPLLTQNTGY
ncbi:RagB/SusD family nutrient uptake outer membrane protein [Puia sp. P3]|uniref:RagB/SusD family nutrient uptake outer membrane protein n=1 Tax=Puia sp. P3 TaxID=3423952 RepID=UPI003D67EEC7